jgi:hypothetical protein
MPVIISTIPNIRKKPKCSCKKYEENKLIQIKRAALAMGKAKLNSFSLSILSHKRKLNPYRPNPDSRTGDFIESRARPKVLKLFFMSVKPKLPRNMKKTNLYK